MNETTTRPLTKDELTQLVDVAEQAIHLAVARDRRWVPNAADYPPPLRAPGAAFVTLRRHGRLLGCIGTLAPTESLVVTVADRARAAAFDDPRFPGITRDDLPELEVSVSVLSRPEPLAATGYLDLLERVRPGVDGLLVESGWHRATLLPSVWEDLTDPVEFVGALWRKAGMEPGAWPHDIHVQRYTAQHAEDDEPMGSVAHPHRRDHP